MSSRFEILQVIVHCKVRQVNFRRTSAERYTHTMMWNDKRLLSFYFQIAYRIPVALKFKIGYTSSYYAYCDAQGTNFSQKL